MKVYGMAPLETCFSSCWLPRLSEPMAAEGYFMNREVSTSLCSFSL